MNNISKRIASMRRKPCLALSANLPSDGVSTASRVTWMEVDDPL